jgi:hypothetical protein
MSEPSRTNEMDQACTAIGELIVWANMIDDQLNEVVVNALALPDHHLVEGIVAQLDVRPKAELLKTRMKLLPEDSPWRVHVLGWVKKVEKVNDNRNIVAHHRVAVKDGKIRLVTSQLSKVLKSIDGAMQPKPDKGLSDIQKWVAEAAAAYEGGGEIIANLSRFRAEVHRRDEGRDN